MPRMPKQNRGKSRQDYATPKAFLDAVKERLHIEAFSIDLAASEENKCAEAYYDFTYNSLLRTGDWNPKPGEWAWLNPPFSNITPWVAKAYMEATQGANIAILVPASVGSNWWRFWVEPVAYQSFLNGRITFVGCKDPYPKDCALLLYTPWGFTGHEIWSWKNV